jgi:cytochrome c-type biogenesis protein
MQYFISFLEGIITFISPCLLPMLPLYVSYFAGGKEERSTKKTIINALGFIVGFTLIFVTFGALAGSVGTLLRKYTVLLNIITGLIVILFGLNFVGLFKLNIFKGINNPLAGKPLGFFSALLFGMIFSIGWTPCVGAFLGSALMMAAGQGDVLTGIIMLLCYSLGLGIPFFVSAILIDKLKSTFSFIKRNYKIINTVSGILLILMGILMMTGLFSRFLSMI